jgi:hypothetical protein
MIFEDMVMACLADGFEIRFEQKREVGRRFKVSLIKDNKILVREENWAGSKSEALLAALLRWQERFGNAESPT